MPSNGIQVAITGEITPTAISDTFAVTNPYWGLGGLRTSIDTLERDAITVSRREYGMVVFVSSLNKYFKLDTGLTNLDWIDLGPSFGVASVVTDSTLTGNGSIATPLGISTSFAENGVNISGSKIRLGGQLQQNTRIDLQGYIFNLYNSGRFMVSNNILGSIPYFLININNVNGAGILQSLPTYNYVTNSDVNNKIIAVNSTGEFFNTQINPLNIVLGNPKDESIGISGTLVTTTYSFKNNTNNPINVYRNGRLLMSGNDYLITVNIGNPLLWDITFNIVLNNENITIQGNI